MEKPRQHYNVTLAALTLAGIAFAFQQTMVVPALPVLQRELDTTTTWATWVLTVFLLVASVATPIIGKLGDQYGKERLLVISLSVFLLGCIGCALAWNIWSLIACRALAGVGAAVFPLSFAIIRDEFPPEKVGVAIGLVSSVFGVGGGFGIVLSGVIVDNMSWRWLFIFGSIGIAFAILLVMRFVPESPIKTPSRIDVPGAALLTGGLVAFLLALTEGENWGWTSGRILGLFGIAAVLLVAWVLVELRVPEPMVDMRMMIRRTVLLTNITALISGFAMFSVFVLVPNFVEMPRGVPEQWVGLVDYGFGASATMAGLYLLPSSIVLLFAGPAAGLIGRHTGFKWPMSIGMALIGIGAGMLAIWHDEPWQIVASQPVFGIGIGFAFAAMATIIAQTVRPSETGVAGGMNTVMRTVGGVIGGQVGAALLTAHTIPGTPIPSVDGFEVAFTLGAIAALIGAVVSLFIVTARQPGRRAVALEPGVAPVSDTGVRHRA